MPHTRKCKKVKKPCKCGIKGYCSMTKSKKRQALYKRQVRNLKIARAVKARQ